MTTQSVRAAAASSLLALSASLSPAAAQVRGGQPATPPPVTTVKPVQPAPGVRPQAVPAETRQRTPRPGEDADGDGYVSAAAGGDDCNDADPQIYPGRTEIPDARDDDCDAATIGFKDDDRDGYIDAAVLNPGGGYGEDCDDSTAAIRPDAQELPNRLDDNCDGLVDNLLGQWWTPR